MPAFIFLTASDIVMQVLKDPRVTIALKYISILRGPMTTDKGRERGPVTLMLLGSGFRFPAFIGALSAIEEKGIKIGRVVGASAGSIIGSLYASGRTPAEMRRIIMDLDTTVFRDFSIRSVIAGKGMYEGRAAEDYIDMLLEGRKFSDDFRFSPYVVATDIKHSIPFVFSRSNFPEMKVSRAIRFSIGIPLVFSYKHFSAGGMNRVFVDGNLLSSTISDMFTGSDLLILKVVSQRTQPTDAARFGLASYLKKLVLIMMNAVEKERVIGKNWQDTIIISCGDIHPAKFAITQGEKKYLIEQGYTQVKQYIEYKWGKP